MLQNALLQRLACNDLWNDDHRVLSRR
jgi:hypothetical protein